MATFGIESNGRLEKTAIYYNGEQIGGVKEIFISIDEDGSLDAFIQYEGIDKKIYTKQIFTEYLDNIKITEPSFSEEEAMELQLFTIESNGDIEETSVFYNDEQLEGIVSLTVHIKGTASNKGIKSVFSKKEIPDRTQFSSEIVFRNDDDSIETEEIF